MKKLLQLLAVSAAISGIFNCIGKAQTDNREIYTISRTISDGLVFSEQRFVDKWDNNQNAFVFELQKQSQTKIKVSYGDYIYGADKLQSMVEKAESNGERVVGAVNADFFGMSTGVPMSLLIDEGKLVSSDDGRCGLGIKDNGEYIIGYPKITLTLTKKDTFNHKNNQNNTVDTELSETDKSDMAELFEQTVGEEDMEIVSHKPDSTQKDDEAENYSFSIEFLNKYPSVYARYLLTDDFSTHTRTSSSNTEIVLRRYSEITDQTDIDAGPDQYFTVGERNYLLEEAHPVIFGSENLVVTEVRQASVNGIIPQGAYVLCFDDVTYKSEAERFEVGDEYTLDISADQEWKNVVSAVGNGGRIISNSFYTEESYDSALYNTKNPRTAAGITEQGNLVIYSVDGRRSVHSAGMTVRDLAQQMIELGCIEAVNFDGGGSTTVYAALPGEKTAVLQNSPSDIVERKVANSLMFINTSSPVGKLVSARMYPESKRLLAGGTSFGIDSLKGYDENYYPVEINSSAEFFTMQDDLKFDKNTCYTTNSTGEFAIYARIDDKIYPCGSVIVPESVDKVSLNIDKQDFYIEDSAKINVGAQTAGENIKCVLSSFTYNDGSLAENYIPNENYILKTDRVEIDTEGNVKALVSDEIITIRAYYGDKNDSVSFIASSEKDMEENTNDNSDLPVYPETDYIDIDSHWAKADIEKCRELGLMSGENTEMGTMFFPERSFSVAEFCTVVSRLCNFDLEQYKSFELPFTDKSEIASWSLPYIKAMYFNGKLDLVIKDNAGKTSSPVSRIDVMAVCGTLCPETDMSCINFSDISYDDFDYLPKKSNEIALQNKLRSVNKAIATGIFHGYDDNTLRPTRNLSRAEAATVFVRLCEALGEQAIS